MIGSTYRIERHRYDCENENLTLKTGNYRAWKRDVSKTKFCVIPIPVPTLMVMVTLGVLMVYALLVLIVQASMESSSLVVSSVVVGVVWVAITIFIQKFLSGKEVFGVTTHLVSVPEYMEYAYPSNLRIIGRGKRTRQIGHPPLSSIDDQKDNVVDWTHDHMRSTDHDDNLHGLTHVIAVEKTEWIDGFKKSVFYLFVTEEVHDMVRKSDEIVEWKYTAPNRATQWNEWIMNMIYPEDRTITFKWTVRIPVKRIDKLRTHDEFGKDSGSLREKGKEQPCDVCETYTTGTTCAQCISVLRDSLNDRPDDEAEFGDDEYGY